MNESMESEEKIHKATLALEKIAEEAEHEREEHDLNQFVMPDHQAHIEPLKGPHHTPSKE